MKKIFASAFIVFTLAAPAVHAETVLAEQSEGSFLAQKVSMLASEYHEVARVNRTRHKNLCFKLGALAEKARGVAAFVQQAAFTNTRASQSMQAQQASNTSFGLDAAVANAGQELNMISDEIQAFCEATGEDVRSTLMPSLIKMKTAADTVADKI